MRCGSWLLCAGSRPYVEVNYYYLHWLSGNYCYDAWSSEESDRMVQAMRAFGTKWSQSPPAQAF